LRPAPPKRTLLATGEDTMKLFGTIMGLLFVLIGIVWILQGANILGGSIMSGQSQWLYIGIIVALVGAGITFLVRRQPPL
jgi:hypothetical protein